MKLKVKQSLIYCGIVYNPGEVVEIIEADVIERVKSLELVEAEEVENEEIIETENLEEVTEENTAVEETTKNSKKSKKA
ncbi:hypothetical protein [Fusobacterium animalis]|uniref:hypothetical protein n=1 Tax=Fusobacterium animalis TaxID=76859 RepID=UPI0030D4AA54